MRIYHLLAVVLIAAATAPSLSAQQSDQWRRIDPPAGPQYHALTWDGDGMLYFVDGGTVVLSADSGRSGNATVVDDQAAFKAIEYVGSSGVWIVGSGGRAYRSIDGTTWQARHVGTPANLVDIAFSTPSIGVVVGHLTTPDSTIMLRTTNAGESWQSVRLPTSAKLFAVKFHGAVGLAVGSDAILRTSDAGATWSAAERYNNQLSAVSFASETVAVAVGSRHYQGQYRAMIVRSTDAGVTWSVPEFDISKPALHDVAFATPLRGTALLTRSGTVMTTTNGGADWSATEAALGHSAYDVEYLDSVYGASVGAGGAVHITTDGGRSWSRRSAAALGGSYTDVALGGNGRIVASGANGHLVISDDHQQSLRPIASTVRSTLTATAWLHNGGFLVVGDSGVVIRGTSAGEIEVATPLGRDVTLSDLAVDASGTVWMVGSSTDTSFVWKSTDGGSEWTPVTSPNNTELYGIATYGDTDIWVVGHIGEIYRSWDGGVTWADRSYSVTHALRAVYAVDRNTVFAVGDGILFRSTDAGETWRVNTTNLFGFRDVEFADGRNGVTVGNYLKALVTTDGGDTWEISTPAEAGDLTGVAVRGGRVVAVSSAGQIVVRDLLGAARVRETAIERGPVLRITRSEGALTVGVDPRSTSFRDLAVVDALGRQLTRITVDEAATSIVRIELPPGTPRGMLFVVADMRDGTRSVGQIEI